MIAIEAFGASARSAEREHPDWLSAYVRYADSEAPLAFTFWTGVFTLAAILQRKVWIDMEPRFTWYPNFYILMVAPSAVATKSSTIGMGADLIQGIDGVSFGPSIGTWQGLLPRIAEARTILEYPQGVYTPTCCLSIYVREFGTFLDPNDRMQTDVLSDLWDGNRLDKATASQGNVLIEHGWLNILGGTTPAWVQQNVPEYLASGGLFSRIIFLYAKHKSKLMAYPDEHPPAEGFRALRDSLRRDLERIYEYKGPFTITPDARRWGNAWYKQHWTQRPPGAMNEERYQGYLGRRFCLLHKASMVLSASRRSDLIIDEKELTDSDALLSSVEKHMQRVLGDIGATKEGVMNQHLLDLIKAYGTIKRTVLWRLMMTRIRRYDDFSEMLKGCEAAGLCRLEARPGDTDITITHLRDH